MLVFLPSLRDLVQAKAEFEQSARARADLLNARAQATAVPGAMAQGKGAGILSAHRPMQSEVLTPTARS